MCVMSMYDTSHPRVWQYPSIRVKWLIRTCDIFWEVIGSNMLGSLITFFEVRHALFTCETWRIHKCDMTQSCVCHDAFTQLSWRIHMWDIIPSYVWHDSFVCMTWPTNLVDMTHSYVWHLASHIRPVICVSSGQKNPRGSTMLRGQQAHCQVQ